MDENKLKIETKLLHAGHKPDKETHSRAVPIYQTTSYTFESTKEAAELFALEKEGNTYSRLANPTNDVFEKRMASLDGGVAALSLSSGQSAIAVSLLTIAQAGDEIVSADNLYGGTYTLFNYTFRKMGINVKFFPSENLEALKKSITNRTKAIYVESIGNPKLNVTDIEAVAKIAHKNGVPLFVDNTVAPYILRPFEWGADICVYSATKFIGGHGTSLGGVIVDSGKFDWAGGKFPSISEDDASYHGLNFLKRFGKLSYIAKARVSLLRDIGCALSPFNAFLFIQGLETLHLRMPRHCENALAVAVFLKKHPKVSWVNYPALPGGKEKPLADKYLKGLGGAIIGFGIKGGASAGEKFINSLELVSHLANIGDAKTLAIHPASTTHQQLSREEQIASGVTDDYIRLSIGLENVSDIIDDMSRALDKV